MIDVHLDHRPGARGRLGRGHHVLGDRLADVRDGHDLFALARRLDGGIAAAAGGRVAGAVGTPVAGRCRAPMVAAITSVFVIRRRCPCPRSWRDPGRVPRPAGARAARGSANAGPRSGMPRPPSAGAAPPPDPGRRAAGRWRHRAAGSPVAQPRPRTRRLRLGNWRSGAARQRARCVTGRTVAVRRRRSISMSAVPTGTVAPSSTRIFVTVPGDAARAPRCRPCPSRSRTAARPARPRRLPLEPLQDRALDDRLAELRHLDRRHDRPPHHAANRSTAASMSATCGRNASSSGGENGTGWFGGASRTTGASRCSKAFSAITAATSAPIPRNR